MIAIDFRLDIFNGPKLFWQDFLSLGAKKVETLFLGMSKASLGHKVNQNTQKDLELHVRKAREDYIRRFNIFYLFRQFAFRA